MVQGRVVFRLLLAGLVLITAACGTPQRNNSSNPSWEKVLSKAGNYPSARSNHSDVYDEANNRIISFAGYGNGYLDDLWSGKIKNNNVTWQRITPSGDKPGRMFAQTSVYDPKGKRMIVFGGSYQDSSTSKGFTYFNEVWILDLATPGKERWSKLTVKGNAPAPRDEHSAVFDTKHSRMIIFGGFDDVTTYGDAWALELAVVGKERWTKITADIAPPACAAPAAVYDSKNERMVLFGGATGNIFSNDTYTLDLKEPGKERWSKLAPKGNLPPGRSAHTTMYDPARQRMIIFGGLGGGSPANDLWALDLTLGKEEWYKISTDRAIPLERISHTAIYNTLTDYMIVFGGQKLGLALEDMWQIGLDGLTKHVSQSVATNKDNTSSNMGDGKDGEWKQIEFTPNTLLPEGRWGQNTVYDSANLCMLMTGGGTGVKCFNDVWVLSLAHGDKGTVWEQLNPQGELPSRRWGQALAYDPERKWVIQFGGLGEGSETYDDTWVLDISKRGDEKWKRLEIKGEIPPARRSISVYDSKNKRITMFGGNGKSGVLNDVWALDLSDLKNPRWNKLTPANSVLPPARQFHTAIYDEPNERMIVFSGLGGDGQRFNDVWEMKLGKDSVTCHPLSPSGNKPSERNSSAFGYDYKNRRFIIFSGGANDKFGDTWALDLSEIGKEKWLQLSVGGKLPEPRLSATGVYDPLNNRMVIFGGAVQGLVNEVWSLELK